MAIAQRRLTVEAFLALPEAEPALELEPDGTVVQKVSPKGPRSALQLALCDRLNQFARPRRLALAFPELRAVFGGAAYVPDVAVYRWARIPRTPDEKVADDFRQAPDIAIEVVSPEQSPNALVRRGVWYTANGVRVALLVDPGDESVVLFRGQAAPRALRAADPVELAEVLPGFHLTAGELFDGLRLDHA